MSAITDCSPKILVLESAVVDTHIYTEEDLLGYAQHLGLSLEFDRDLLWIASAGLYAAIPKPWIICQAEGREDIFYFNPETRESAWEHPSDAFYMELLEQTVQSRVTVVVTLRAEQKTEHGALTLVGTRLSGEEAVRVCMLPNDKFGDARRYLEKGLGLPRGAVSRFLLESGEALGHSSDAKSLCSIFGVTASRPHWTAAVCSSSLPRAVPRPAAQATSVSMPYIDGAADAERLGFTVEMSMTL